VGRGTTGRGKRVCRDRKESNPPLKWTKLGGRGKILKWGLSGGVRGGFAG